MTKYRVIILFGLGALIFVAYGFLTPPNTETAFNKIKITSIPCDTRIYSPVLNDERYRFECYTITFDTFNLVPQGEIEWNSLHNSFGEGGMFEIVLPNTVWSSELDLCPYFGIRMPWSDPDMLEPVMKKKSLFQEVTSKMETSSLIEADIVVPVDTAFNSSHTPAEIDQSAQLDPENCLSYFAADGTSGNWLQ
ncbi:hypothetical protein [Litoreibacter halocynthiae]|uniref:hypothetical protein n=1 Tax=Litoreibacter halocynthiae TaxID=1242689 RepID=UPI00249178A2|nr:hypothetical protein [Litoreibacter halocynthiae]